MSESTKSTTLPEPWPKLRDSRAAHAAWVSKATRHKIVASWRPGRTETAGLVVRLDDNRELCFATVAEASRPERFISAFTSLDGIVMPNYPLPMVRELVGALVRMAQIDSDEDERTEFAGIGSDYLQGCLLNSGRIAVDLSNRDAAFYAARGYQNTVAMIKGEPGDPWPPVLYAADSKVLHVPRRLLYAYARRYVRGLDAHFLAMQMIRLDWEEADVQPRPPKTVKAARPRLRLWAIPEGWDGVTAADHSVGDVETPGDGSNAHAHARAHVPEGSPGVSTSPRLRRSRGV